MLVRSNEREVVLQCDGGEDPEYCLAVFYADTNDLSEAQLMAEADGWSIGVDDEHEVFYYCPKCAPKNL